MTTPIPRRTKDLLEYNIDSEDDFNTPCKPAQRKDAKAAPAHKLEAFANANKENVGQSNKAVSSSLLNGNKGDISYNLFPKRPSEMQLLDSDSDEEDNKTNQNLNCAILNDSFIMSPSHEPTSSTSSSFSATAAALKRTDSNLSFLGRFGNMGINCSSTNQKSPSLVEAPSSTLPTISEQRNAAADLETPLGAAAAKSHAKHEPEFVTPQVRSISTTARGTRSRSSAVANEFRSQKVLFQTPMTVSRAAPFPSDSISFSLCDTISESPDTPAQKPPVQEPAKLPSKQEAPRVQSKKSLEGAFRETEKPDKLPDKVAKALPEPPPAAASNVLHIKNHDYIIVRKLGCGGSSSVYLARRQDTGEEFALKVVDLQADPVVVKGYLNETELLYKLQGNVCVVALYEYQLLREESKLYLVMEKGDSDLNKILQSYTTNLPLYNLMNILYQMLQAVNYIHQHGVIHSDLKPANFLMVNGRLKLIDFGIASNIAVDSTSIIKFSQAGTFNYISPEALTDISTGSSPMRSNQPKIKISTKSDVWSLGCILYLLLYQKTPFSHIRNIHAKMSAIASPSTSIEFPAIPIYYPIMLVHMAKNCLQLNPKKRPSCAELLQYPFHMIIPIQNLTLGAKR